MFSGCEAGNVSFPPSSCPSGCRYTFPNGIRLEVRSLWPTGIIRGDAWPTRIDEPPPPGTPGTRIIGGAGGGDNEEACYESYLWWYDACGTYHEDTRGTWCVEWET